MSSSGMTVVKFIFVLFNLAFLAGAIAIIYLGAGILTENIYIEYENLTKHVGVSNLAYILITLGAFILIISFLGCWGALRDNSCMLVIFGSIMAAIILAQFILCGLLFLYKTEFQVKAHEDFLPKVIKNYNYTDSSNQFTIVVDKMQKLFKCCGINGTHDWPEDRIPASCCSKEIVINAEFFPTLNEVQRENICKNDQENPAFKDGCLKKIVDSISQKIWYLLATAFSFALIEIMAVVLSCFIAYSAKKSYQTM